MKLNVGMLFIIGSMIIAGVTVFMFDDGSLERKIGYTVAILSWAIAVIFYNDDLA